MWRHLPHAVSGLINEMDLPAGDKHVLIYGSQLLENEARLLVTLPASARLITLYYEDSDDGEVSANHVKLLPTFMSQIP